MARKALDVRIRIERQEKKILKLKQELEEAQDEYENFSGRRRKPIGRNCSKPIRKADGAWMRS